MPSQPLEKRYFPPEAVDTQHNIGKFGKAEVEHAASDLVKFFKFKREGWCRFTFEELARFYRLVLNKPSGEMLFGLFGAWIDDTVGTVPPAENFIIHCGDYLIITDAFLERIKGNLIENRHWPQAARF